MVMNPEVKAEWLAALRSGDYRQGRNQLKTEEGEYCCLGVACNLAVMAGVITEWLGSDYPYFGDEEEWGASPADAMDNGSASWAELPVQVQEWMDLVGDPIIELPENHLAIPMLKDRGSIYGEERNVKISQLNDSGMSFEQIADLIEAQL